MPDVLERTRLRPRLQTRDIVVPQPVPEPKSSESPSSNLRLTAISTFLAGTTLLGTACQSSPRTPEFSTSHQGSPVQKTDFEFIVPNGIGQSAPRLNFQPALVEVPGITEREIPELNVQIIEQHKREIAPQQQKLLEEIRQIRVEDKNALVAVREAMEKVGNTDDADLLSGYPSSYMVDFDDAIQFRRIHAASWREIPDASLIIVDQGFDELDPSKVDDPRTDQAFDDFGNNRHHGLSFIKDGDMAQSGRGAYSIEEALSIMGNPGWRAYEYIGPPVVKDPPTDPVVQPNIVNNPAEPERTPATAPTANTVVATPTPVESDIIKIIPLVEATATPTPTAQTTETVAPTPQAIVTPVVQTVEIPAPVAQINANSNSIESAEHEETESPSAQTPALAPLVQQPDPRDIVNVGNDSMPSIHDLEEAIINGSSEIQQVDSGSGQETIDTPPVPPISASQLETEGDIIPAISTPTAIPAATQASSPTQPAPSPSPTASTQSTQPAQASPTPPAPSPTAQSTPPRATAAASPSPSPSPSPTARTAPSAPPQAASQPARVESGSSVPPAPTLPPKPAQVATATPTRTENAPAAQQGRNTTTQSTEQQPNPTVQASPTPARQQPQASPSPVVPPVPAAPAAPAVPARVETNPVAIATGNGNRNENSNNGQAQRPPEASVPNQTQGQGVPPAPTIPAPAEATNRIPAVTAARQEPSTAPSKPDQRTQNGPAAAPTVPPAPVIAPTTPPTPQTRPQTQPNTSAEAPRPAPPTSKPTDPPAPKPTEPPAPRPTEPPTQKPPEPAKPAEPPAPAEEHPDKEETTEEEVNYEQLRKDQREMLRKMYIRHYSPRKGDGLLRMLQENVVDATVPEGTSEAVRLKITHAYTAVIYSESSWQEDSNYYNDRSAKGLAQILNGSTSLTGEQQLAPNGPATLYFKRTCKFTQKEIDLIEKGKFDIIGYIKICEMAPKYTSDARNRELILKNPRHVVYSKWQDSGAYNLAAYRGNSSVDRDGNGNFEAHEFRDVVVAHASKVDPGIGGLW